MITTCQICGAPVERDMPLVEDPITRECFSVPKCTSCGLGHTAPRPDDLAPFYPADYYGGRHGFTARYCINRRLRIVSHAVSGYKTHSLTSPALLDIGCGDGSFLLAAKAQGWQVAGVERFPDTARDAGLTIAEDPDEFRGRQFDCITLWHSLEHMPNPDKMLEQIAALLKPEGKVVIAVPDFDGWQAVLFRRHWLHLDVPRHLYHFTRSSVRESFRSVGLILTHTRHQEFEYDLLGWSQSLLNAFFPTPNVFFNWLTGRPARCDKLETLAQVIAGLAFSVLFVPAVWTGSVFGKGGTLIVCGGHQ